MEHCVIFTACQYGNGSTVPVKPSTATQCATSSLTHRSSGRPRISARYDKEEDDDIQVALENVPVGMLPLPTNIFTFLVHQASLTKLQQAKAEKERPICLLDSLTQVERSTVFHTWTDILVLVKCCLKYIIPLL